MSQPVLNWYGVNWCWSCDRDPTPNEPNDTGIINMGNFWLNTIAGTMWMCWDQGSTEPDNTNLSWAYCFTITLPPAISP